MVEQLLDAVDIRHLHYFAVVAEENSFRKAAERLFMAQPPLSRQVKQLENRLGVALFVRHSKGLTLTPQGERVLAIVRPLLEMKDATYAKLREEVHSEGKTLRVGFTTAFEQGVFAGLEAELRERHDTHLHISRATSPRLVTDIRKGNLDAAFVALPLEAPGLSLRPAPYAEPLVAAVPTSWVESGAMKERRFSLKNASGKSLFWFKREANPAFFDFTKTRFSLAEFTPRFIEEPTEHDVLLARIAAGEGMGLFAASFAAIKRDGVSFINIAVTDLCLELGVITAQFNVQLAESLAAYFISTKQAIK